jgi:glycosyltransferase involved in cell wall biosynthesis
MSTAIAEATLAGIPVIQSDIPGTYWNANNPSVFLFKSGNIDDLVTKMEMVIKSNRTQLIEDCRISRQNNLERLQIDTWCKKVLDSYLLL